MKERKPRIGITQGDTNGIGYEVILKALEDNRMLELCTPIIYGSAKIAAYYRKGLQLPAIPFVQISSIDEVRDGAYNIINVVGEDVKIEPGVPTEASALAALAALERAVTDVKAGKIDALVTAPINKHSIQCETFNFPGHTEYLEAATADEGRHALMILFDENLHVALQTTHLPIEKVASAITREAIVEKLETFSRSLHRDFAIFAPRIAVLALNPHAGDDGLLGSQESEIIAPAIAEAREKKILAFGPYSPDGFFGSGNFVKFDGVLAMYHDQGLIPFKTMAMDYGVNFTAGLPIVRTSPDHGTAFDIAGKGEANPESMRQAIYAAIDICRNRRSDEYAHRHPLRRQYFEKGSDNVVLDLSGDE